jgi:signal transduction histidine kinase
MYQPLEYQPHVVEPLKNSPRVFPLKHEPNGSFLEVINLTTSSTLADLPVHHFQVDTSTPAANIDYIFRHRREIPGVLIIENQTLAGIISRRKFFEHMGQLYGTAVYLNRPIKVMLKSIGVEWLHLPSTTKIYEATHKVFRRSEHWVYEPIVVEFDDHAYRLLDARILLIAQNQLFAGLQRELQAINNQLELRVEQRTAELAQTNTELAAEINRRKQAQEALILARDQALEANRLKSELLARVSHELRTPIGAILGFAEMLELEVYGPVSQEQKGITTKITKSSKYLEEMVNDLLDQAKLEAGKFSLTSHTFDPREIVDNTVAKMTVLAENKQLTLTSKVAANMPSVVTGDKIRIQQILVNLVSNAIKFTDRGIVRIRVYCPDNQHWALQVSDTGCGIPREAQTHIFEPFRQVDGSATRRHGGTGLGLSIVEQLTKLMNGEIVLASEVGHGSTFTVILPLEQQVSAKLTKQIQIYP